MKKDIGDYVCLFFILGLGYMLSLFHSKKKKKPSLDRQGNTPSSSDSFHSKNN